MKQESTTPNTPRIQISIPPRSLSSSDDDDDEEEHEFGDDDDDDVGSPLLAAMLTTPNTNTTSDKNYSPASSSSSSINGSTDMKKFDPSSSTLEFPINVECTSLCISPSGNFVWGGFSDGTIRVFDNSGKFDLTNNNDDKLLGINGRRRTNTPSNSNKTHMFVASKWCQTYGAVACQIHARGVHTDLLTHVAHAEEDYVFGGVQRGAMEVYAVGVNDLEQMVSSSSSSLSSSQGKAALSAKKHEKNILDCLNVHVCSDAKLKGFGACTKLKNVSRPTYLLLTGTGIKNIHIWRFQPPITEEEDEDGIWEQLYDTPSNGNTINLFSFYRDSHQKLWAISKSDVQKIRLWDLSCEEKQHQKQRAKRPPYLDVENSRSALGVAESFCVCGGGPTMYNQLSIVSLDQPKSAYNHTELELPATTPTGITSSSSSSCGGRGGSGRYARRGNLKQVTNVAVSTRQPHHALLELDDGSLVHYSAATAATVVSCQATGIPDLPADFWKRTFCLGTISDTNAVVVAMGLYNPNTQQGRIVMRPLVKGNKPKPAAQSTSSKVVTSPSTTDVQALKQLCMEATMCTPKNNQNSRLFGSPSSSVEAESIQSDNAIHGRYDQTKKKSLTKKSKLEKSTNQVTATANMIFKTPSPTLIPKKKKKRKMGATDSSSIRKGVLQVKTTHDNSERKASQGGQTSTQTLASCSASNVKVPPPQIKATQVSPEQKQATPSEEGTPMDGNSPHDQSGDIEKFLQPKRVLHQWSDEQYKKCQEKNGKGVLKSAGGTTTASKDKSERKIPVTSRAVSSTLDFPVKKVTPVAMPSAKANQLKRKEAKKAPSLIVAETVSTSGKKLRTENLDNLHTKLQDKNDTKKMKKKMKLQRPVQESAKNSNKENISNKDRTKTQAQLDSSTKKKAEPVERRLSDSDSSENKKKRKQSPNVERGLAIVSVQSIDARSSKDAKMRADNQTPRLKKKPKSVEKAHCPEADVASILCELKSSPLPSRVQSPASSEASSSPTKQPPSLSREENMKQRLAIQHNRLTVEIDHANEESEKCVNRRFASVPLFTDAFAHPEEASRSKLQSQHRAEHVMIRKRLLRAAATSLRVAMEGGMSMEEVRSDLKTSIQAYEEVLHDTLQRQTLEASCLAEQHTKARSGMTAPKVDIRFPFLSSFILVEEIGNSLKRTAGRPKSGK